MTLPLIYALQKASGPNRTRIQTIVEHADVSAIQELVQLIGACGALEATCERAKMLGIEAHQALSCLPESVYKQALETLISLVIERGH